MSNLTSVADRQIRRIIAGTTFDSDNVECVASYVYSRDNFKRYGYVSRNKEEIYYEIRIVVTEGPEKYEWLGANLIEKDGEVYKKELLNGRYPFEEIYVERISRERAVKLCEEYSADIHIQFFELPTEANPAEEVETFLLRLPASLKKKVASRAEREKTSITEAMVACLQGYLQNELTEAA